MRIGVQSYTALPSRPSLFHGKDQVGYDASQSSRIMIKQSVCANVKKKKFLEELYERSQILPKLEKLFSSFSHIASKVKSSKKVEKNFNQIRYLIELMNDFCYCKAYL